VYTIFGHKGAALMLRKTIFLLLSVGWLGGVWVEVIWAGETTPVKTAEKRTAKPQPGEKPTPLSETEKRALQDLWRNIYTRPEQLAKLSQPTVCILDIQHPDRIYEQLRTLPRPMEQFYACTFRAKVAEISGLPTLVVHATEITGQDLDRPQIKAILIGGRSKSLPREVDERFYPLIRQTKIPILGICGGCQLIGRAYGAKVTHMRKLQPGEADPNPKYHPGWFKEWGPTALEVLKPDPLFANLPEKPIFREFHAFQIQEPPAEFDLLASTKECRVQAIKHRDRLVYAVQFHPERYDAKHPHGRVLLENFFRLALGKLDSQPPPEGKK